MNIKHFFLFFILLSFLFFFFFNSPSHIAVFSWPIRTASNLTCFCLINGAILANLLGIPGGAPEAVCDKISAHAQSAASQFTLSPSGVLPVRWQIDRTVDGGAPFNTTPVTSVIYSDISAPLFIFVFFLFLFLVPLASSPHPSTNLTYSVHLVSPVLLPTSVSEKKVDVESRMIFCEAYAKLLVDVPSTPHFYISKN